MSLTVFDCNDMRLYSPIANVFGINQKEYEIIDRVKEDAWKRCMFCFDHINNDKFNTGGCQIYHCVQYGMWLYFLSNEIYRCFGTDETAINVCDKIFLMNMSFTQMDIYYGHNMPDVFLPAHTSGVVFSPLAKIGEFFMFNHGCNVGLNTDPNTPPCIGNYVIMMGNSKIVGNCNVGEYVIFGANSYIKDMDIPSHSLVFGQYPNVIVKEDKKGIVEGIMKERFRKIF